MMTQLTDANRIHPVRLSIYSFWHMWSGWQRRRGKLFECFHLKLYVPRS